MESPNLCRQCKGHCCKTAPGCTTPDQWGKTPAEMKQNLIGALKSGHFFIDAQAGQIKDVYWTVRPRLKSNGCIFLTKSGCRLDHDQRPTACQQLIPAANFPEGCRYQSDVYKKGHEMIHWGTLWLPYKSLLKQVLKELQ